MREVRCSVPLCLHKTSLIPNTVSCQQSTSKPSMAMYPSVVHWADLQTKHLCMVRRLLPFVRNYAETLLGPTPPTGLAAVWRNGAGLPVGFLRGTKQVARTGGVSSSGQGNSSVSPLFLVSVARAKKIISLPSLLILPLLLHLLLHLFFFTTTNTIPQCHQATFAELPSRLVFFLD